MFKKKSLPPGADKQTSAPPAKAEGKPAPKPDKKGFKLFGGTKTGTASSGKPVGTPESSAPIKAASDATKSAPKQEKKKGGGGPLKLLLPLVLIVAIAGGGYFVVTRFLGGGGAPENAAPATAPTAAPVAELPLSNPQTALSEGDAISTPKPVKKKAKPCGGTPKFLAGLKLSADAKFTTNEPDTRGLVLLTPVENSDAVSKYQHQSWNRAGFLDAFVIDQNGNVYAAPSPRTGLGITKPTKQDHIFKLDTNSGELKDMLTLPSAAPTSPENPYGVLGLALDCETNSLYATTVTGSTDAGEIGRIYRIDLTSGEVAGQLDAIDGYGVAVRASANGKQLIFGSARDAKLRAVDLDAEGNFQGEPREIASLEDSQRARQISFPNENAMVVQAVEFSFSKTEIPQGTNVSLEYDAAGEKWTIAQ